MSLRRAPVCAQCGSLNCKEIEVLSTEAPFNRISGFLCEACFTKAIEVHQELKRQFEELIELGVNRVLANEVMIDRVERLSAPQVAA